MVITATTIAMTEPHDIDYTIHITKNDTGSSDKPSGDEVKDGTYIGNVEHTYGTKTMFKIIACKLVAQSGKVTATITLSSDGYDRLFLGSKEDALKADDSNLISYKVDGNGKYTYTFSLPGLNQEVKLAARSHRYYEAGDKEKSGMTIP